MGQPCEGGGRRVFQAEETACTKATNGPKSSVFEEHPGGQHVNDNNNSSSSYRARVRPLRGPKHLKDGGVHVI